MENILYATLTLCFGIVIGLNVKRFVYYETKRMNTNESFKLDVERASPRQSIRVVLDAFEIRILENLLNEAFTPVEQFNEILKLMNLSKENQRQRRHLFIKELNLKLNLLLYVANGIDREESEHDKRVKRYILNELIDRDVLFDFIEKQKKR